MKLSNPMWIIIWAVISDTSVAQSNSSHRQVTGLFVRRR